MEDLALGGWEAVPEAFQQLQRKPETLPPKQTQV